MYRTTNKWLLVAFTVLAVGIIANDYFGVVRCPSVEAFGKECVLCGCTRDFFTLLHGGGELINPVSPFLFAFTAVEIVLRIALSFLQVPRGFMLFDIVLHCALGAFVLVVNFIVLM